MAVCDALHQPKVAVIGNPNCGKTALFNSLTGLNQKVGNWSGVTVERKSGQVLHQGASFELIDLPGTYSLNLPASCHGADETVAVEYLHQEHFDLILNVVNAANLERHLYLTLELLEMGLPVILVLNMCDLLKTPISVATLSEMIGCPVVCVSAAKQTGIKKLIELVFKQIKKPSPNLVPTPPYPPVIQSAIEQVARVIPDRVSKSLSGKRSIAVRCLQSDENVTGYQNPALDNCLALFRRNDTADADIVIAKARYDLIQRWLQPLEKQSSQYGQTLTRWIDNVALHRFLGIPFFLLVMYCLFIFAIHVGGLFTPFFEILADGLFVDAFGHLLSLWHAPTWLIALLADGVGMGISVTLSFIPVIGAMFLFLSFLESSGYMARATVIVDRLMRAIGLPGKSFVPMIVSFGCNVPAIMSTRSLENKRDRILAIMMSPFMSCGARLAIYTLFVAAFFPDNGHNVVFVLYLIGIAMALLTGFLLKSTLLKGEASPLVLELPAYHFPKPLTLCRLAGRRLNQFLVKAGKLIVPLCLLIGMLNSVSIDGQWRHEGHTTDSILAAAGRTVTPIFAPIGITDDNWPATVGLMMGVMAKEVVVGTMNALYSQDTGLAEQDQSENGFQLTETLHLAVASVQSQLSAFSQTLFDPVNGLVDDSEITDSIFSVMQQNFDGQVGAFAYLLFVLLYFPCVSATGAMIKESNRRWALFSVVWTTSIAYVVAATFYQIATFGQHPLYSMTVLIGCFLLVAALVFACMQFGLKLTKEFPTPIVMRTTEIGC